MALIILLATHARSSAAAPDHGNPIPAFTATSSSHISINTAPTEGASDSKAPAAKTVATKQKPDWDGIKIDTGILFSAQIVVTGLVYFMPESVSSWSSEQKKNTFKKYASNVSDPVFDGDKFYINYLVHPYWGATYYTRARERGLDKMYSFAYSALISTMYEFGVECFFEKPSIQDLVVTPVVGSLLGAYIFEPWRESIKRKKELRWYDHTALVATDPVGVLSSGFERLFGVKPTIRVDYSVPQIQNRSDGTAPTSKDGRIGVILQFPLK